jgi:hypothetical protein
MGGCFVYLSKNDFEEDEATSRLSRVLNPAEGQSCKKVIDVCHVS